MPVAFAGPDLSICLGDTTVLNGTGGTSCIWSPATGLSNANVPAPLAFPNVTTTYELIIFDGNGCFDNDSVTVTVNPLPVAYAGPDVTICFGENGFLQASGGIAYNWSPATWLDNANVDNPAASPIVTTTYTVTVTDANGCSETDDVEVLSLIHI